MTLRRKFVLRNLALLLALAALGAVCASGLLGVRRHLATVSYVYENLATIETAEVKLATLAGDVQSPRADASALASRADDVIALVDRFANPRWSDAAQDAEPGGYATERLAAAGVLARLRAARDAMKPRDAGASTAIDTAA